jgi:pimeloyl-ACP methyl ester carboxylesterase
MDAAVAEFLEEPFEEVSIVSHDGLTLKARYYHYADGAPLEIQCHGYKGNPLRDFCGNWRVAKADGRNVLLIHQRCHWESQGHTITFGILERRDVLGWIRWANDRFGEVPILLSGVSMGAATVLMASAMELPGNVKAVVADCPYDAPSNIIKKVLGQDMGMPVAVVYPLIRFGGMVYGRFNLNADSPLKAVKKTKLPILLIHGDADDFVPYDMSRNLHAAAPEKITFHTVPGAGHALNYVKDPETYVRVIREFTGKHL